jgi:uncharacterized protein YtpQ (UPF0354 family)
MTAKWLQKFFHQRSQAQTGTAPDSNWRDALAKAELSKKEFCELCLVAMSDLFPDIVVESGESYDQFKVERKDREPTTVFLENIWRQTRHAPESREQQVERFLRVFGRLSSSTSELPQRNCIVPMIKDEAYFDVSRKLSKEDAPFANEHLLGDLWIVYAIDTPDSMLTLQKSHLSDLGLEVSELRELAVANLRRILPPVEKHGEGPVYMLTAGGDYVASLLLFDDVWAELQHETSGAILAAVPSRDVLLFTDGNSKEGLEQMKATISRVMESGGYLVSSTILKRSDERWEVFSLT